MAGTVFKLGYTNPLTDSFGAHPTLGAVIDLNDGVTFTLASPDGLEIAAPPRSIVLAGNIRSQGEIATRAITRHNRNVTARLFVGPASSSSALISAIRNLLTWLAAPPQTPITLQYQPFNATTPLYLDVVGAAHNLPADEGQWLRGQFEPLTITFTARPGMRGDRLTFQNLAVNPGFEQPGTAGITVFNDPLATVSYYVSKAGSAPTVGSVNNNYPDVVKADSPLRYYRMSESSGVTAYDASGTAQHGTYVASPTLGVASGVSGDANDKAVTFAAASSQYVSVPAAGLPTGNNPWTIEAAIKVAALPGATQVIAAFGTAATRQLASIVINATGVLASTFGGDTAVTALTTNAWHLLHATWDGTTLTMYIDGASVKTATPGALNVVQLAIAAIAGRNDVSNFASGTLDEIAFYGTALNSTRITAHWNAFNAGTGMGTQTTTLTLAAAARIAFGSPGWQSVNTWQSRFRFTSGGTYRFYLHFTDASNYLRASVTGTAITLEHTIAGVTNTLATTALTLASNVWYWIRLTQFPAAPGEVVDVQAALFGDGVTVGSIGSQYAIVGPAPTADALTALSGQPQIEASGASLLLGGPYSSVHTLSLFGPGGWQFGVVSGVPQGAWEHQTISGVQSPTTYPGGPVSSFGSARIDAPAAGAWDGQWRTYLGGSPTGTFAIPAAPSQTFAGSVWVKTSGMSGTATQSLVAREYDASGSLLRSGTIAATHTGNLAAWTQLSGTYTTGASCAWLDLACEAADSTANSASGTVWFDNAQLWNQTTTGSASMPWCDLRAAVSPAMLVVSGLVGDLPAPAFLAVGTYVASLPSGGALSLYLGRKAVTSPRAQLVNVSYGAFSALFTPQGFGLLDTGAYGGFDSVASLGNSTGWNPRFESLLASDAPGVYHLLARVYTEQSGGNVGNISLRVGIAQQTIPWFNSPAATEIVGQWTGSQVYPFVAAATWIVADAGQAQLPPFPQGAMTDPSQLYLTPRAQWQDTSLSNANGRTNWQALLPVDGSLLVATINNPSNSAGAITNKWLWAYADGLLVNRAGVGDGPSWLYSLESGPTPNPKQGAGGAGTQSSGAVNVNSGADPALVLDPSQVGANAIAGVNQLVAILSDQAGGVYPCFGEVSYSPLYLEPR